MFFFYFFYFTMLVSLVKIVLHLSLQLLYMMLKHGKISTSDQEHQQMLDPFVELLTNCLRSKYNKVCGVHILSFQRSRA